MSGGMIRALDQLISGFGKPLVSLSAARCDALLSAARCFDDAAKSRDALTRLHQRKLKIKVLHLARQLAALDEPLAAALAAAGSPTSGPHARQASTALLSLHRLFDAACTAVTACCTAALELGWQGGDVQKVCASARLVFRAGQPVLAAQLAALPQPREAHATRQNAGVAAEEEAAHCRDLWKAATDQLQAIHVVTGQLCHPSKSLSAAAECAATVATPALLLPWLNTLSQALMSASAGSPEGTEWIFTTSAFGGLASRVLLEPATSSMPTS